MNNLLQTQVAVFTTKSDAKRNQRAWRFFKSFCCIFTFELIALKYQTLR